MFIQLIHSNEIRQCQLITQYYNEITLLNLFFQACNQKNLPSHLNDLILADFYRTIETGKPMQVLYHKQKKGSRNPETLF